MKIGIVAQYYGFRNDVRRLIQELAQRHEVVLLAGHRDLEQVMRSGLEAREITSRKRGKWNRTVELLYDVFGNLPADRKNYYHWRLRNMDSGIQGLKWNGSRAQLELGVRMPDLVGYDWFVRNIRYDDSMDLSNIDVILNMSAIDDRVPYLLAQAREMDIPVLEYVYSWDHPAKFNQYSRELGYLVWNDSIRDDMVELHGLDPASISVVGATQLVYLHEYLNGRTEAAPASGERYVYYCASAGYPKVLEQEVKLMSLISDVLKRIDPSMTLLIRPYPHVQDWGVYAPVLEKGNTRIDDYRSDSSDHTFTEEALYDKYDKISGASLFINMSSTIGVEASYFDVPVLQMQISDADFLLPQDHPSSLGRFLDTYHSRKYLLHYEFPNVVRSLDDLSIVMEGALQRPEDFMGYNRRLSSYTQLRSMEKIVQDVESHLRNATESVCAAGRAQRALA